MTRWLLASAAGLALVLSAPDRAGADILPGTILVGDLDVPALGDSAHGFPYLSGMGRLVIKDAIMLGAAFVTLADSARSYLRRIA